MIVKFVIISIKIRLLKILIRRVISMQSKHLFISSVLKRYIFAYSLVSAAVPDWSSQRIGLYNTYVINDIAHDLGLFVWPRPGHLQK